MRAAPIKMPSCACPSCGLMLDQATAAVWSGESPPPIPRSGDITICVYCTEVLLFKEDMTVRAATRADLEQLDVSTQMGLLLMQETLRSSINKKIRRLKGEHAH